MHRALDEGQALRAAQRVEERHDSGWRADVVAKPRLRDFQPAGAGYAARHVDGVVVAKRRDPADEPVAVDAPSAGAGHVAAPGNARAAFRYIMVERRGPYRLKAAEASAESRQVASVPLRAALQVFEAAHEPHCHS